MWVQLEKSIILIIRKVYSAELIKFMIFSIKNRYIYWKKNP